MEKDKLRKDLEKALGEVDGLKTMLAKETLNTIHTQMDESYTKDNIGGKMVFKNIVEGAGVGNSFGIKNDRPAVTETDMRRDRARSNMTRIGLKVPNLDLSNLKQVKDYKDWYQYSKKLEDAIKLLRERINFLEEDSIQQVIRIESLSQQNEELHDLNVQLSESYHQLLKRSDLLPIHREGLTQKRDISFGVNSPIDSDSNGGPSGPRRKKRSHTVTLFCKKNLTLAVEEINRENEQRALSRALLKQEPIRVNDS